jgi:ABC-type Fe3+/spermidine/putrescine transport system ATPase subunit
MSLKISNLSKRFDDKWVLKDVTLTVENGEVMGLFGATASGKSTFVNIVAGRLRPNGGTITYDDQDVTKLSREGRQFHFPEVENRSIWKVLFNTDKDSELADGEGQSIAFDKALRTAEDVLLLDNSFCDMDKQLRESRLAKLRRVASERNLAVIFATNDYSEVLLACDRVAILADGEFKQIGVPQEVYDDPNSASVAAITGRNNLFTARRLTSSKADLPEFHTIDGEHRLFARKADINSLGPINQNITLAIRPEHISISFGASFPADNLLKATVTRVQPLGPTTLIDLDSGGLKLKALVLRLVGLNVGEECMIGLPPERIHILRR